MRSPPPPGPSRRSTRSFLGTTYQPQQVSGPAGFPVARPPLPQCAAAQWPATARTPAQTPGGAAPGHLATTPDQFFALSVALALPQPLLLSRTLFAVFPLHLALVRSFYFTPFSLPSAHSLALLRFLTVSSRSLIIFLVSPAIPLPCLSDPPHHPGILEVPSKRASSSCAPRAHPSLHPSSQVICGMGWRKLRGCQRRGTGGGGTGSQ